MNEDPPYRNVDSELVEFVKLVREHGLIVNRATMGITTERPTLLAFPSVTDGVEFLEQTVHLTEYIYGSNIALTLLPPEGEALKPGSQVAWVPEITSTILEVWEKKGS